MRIWLLLCAVCLMLLNISCKRVNHANTNTSASQMQASDVNNGQTEARALVEKGKELYRNDEDSKAAESFREAIKLNPELAEAHFRLALAYEALNKQDEAEAEYKKAVEAYKKLLETDSKNAEAHYQFGQTYAGLHQYSDAIREFRQAVKIKSDDPDIYFDLGMAHTKLAQYDEAVSAFSKSLELDPENYRAQDALDDAREGVKRIQAGKKHQEELYKKQQEDEVKKAGEGTPGSSPPKHYGIKG